MRFHKNAQVLTADGTMVGTIDRLILDPDQTDITHLVVREGALLDEDRLVPVAEVDRTSGEDAVVLRRGVSPREFDAFIEDQYRAVTVERPMFGPPGLALYPLQDAPQEFVSWSADRPGPTVATAGSPAGSTAIELGAPVITRDGRRLGSVRDVVISEDGELEGIMAKSGLLRWKRHWMIPAVWVRRVTDDAVYIAITKEQAQERVSQNPTWTSRIDGAPRH